MREKIIGKVARVIDECKVVINKGSIDGLSKNHKVLIYYNEDEVFDPDTQKSLGRLEIICGIGKVEHMQEKMATIISALETTEKVMMTGLFGLPTTKEVTVPAPFNHISQANLLFKVIN